MSLDYLAQLLGGIGNAGAAAVGIPSGVSDAGQAGTYAGIQRSQATQWQTSRITITAEQIANSSAQQDVFQRAVAEEWSRMQRQLQRDLERDMYNVSGFYDLPAAMDPDMEMDIGL